MEVEVSGIQVEIQKKDIKHLHLAVKPPNGKVSVSAPDIMTDESIIMFIRTKIGWVKRQQEKFKCQLRQSEREYVSGETMYVFGKQYFLRTDFSYKGNSIKLDGDTAILTVRKESTAKQREAFVHEWYRDLLKKNIEVLLPKWEKLTGLYCDSWQTKYMTSKWGSCIIEKKKIWFNLQLAQKPIECLEYVILHELVHLKTRKHNKDFIDMMDQYMPYWRSIRGQLNELKLDYLKTDWK